MNLQKYLKKGGLLPYIISLNKKSRLLAIKKIILITIKYFRKSRAMKLNFLKNRIKL